MRTITIEWLKEQRACREGLRWFGKHKEADTRKALLLMIEYDHADYANWSIVRMMTHKQKVQFAIFAAEQALPIFEKKYPNDERPRKAIDAAKAWLKDASAYAADAAANAAADADAAYVAADSAADAAAYAAATAYAAYAAADSAAYAADAAANAAYAAADSAADAASDAASDSAAYAAATAYAADADRKAMQIKIIEHGLELLNL
jgi:hypothetical protein